MERKRVYTFGNGKAEGKADMRNLLGGKGANLAEMNLIGVPVPPAFSLLSYHLPNQLFISWIICIYHLSCTFSK